MKKTLKLVISATCVAIGILLPMAFHTIPNAGRIFLPMHIPILLVGFVCGFQYGLICGIITPLLSFALTGMPQSALLVGMVFELAMYGFVSGFIFKIIKTKYKIFNIYISLICAMLLGRVTSGIINGLVLGISTYTFNFWLTISFITAFPGIIIQLLLLPSAIRTLQHLKII